MILTLWYNKQRLRGEVNCNFICKLANCTFVLTNKQPFLKLPYWDEMGWGVGGNSRTRQQVSSFVSGLSKRISAFLRLEAFFEGMLSSKSYFNKYIYTLHKLFRKCHTFKQIAVSFLLAAFVREDYTKDIFPMVSGTDRPENSWCGRKKIRGFQTRNSQLVQRLVSRNRNMRTSKVFSFPLQLLVTQLMLWIVNMT